MKIICIYGAPAVGKLTVSRELSGLLNLPVFHNHIAIDVAESMFAYGSPEYKSLHVKITSAICQTVLEFKASCIMTFCPSGKAEEYAWLEQFFLAVEECGGMVFLVRLEASEQVLRERVLSEERKQYTKVKSVDGLNNILKKKIFHQDLPGRVAAVIENSSLSAKETAKLIVEQIEQHK